MKILPIMYSQNTINKNEQIRYSRFETPQDTFTKNIASSKPSFGHAESLAKLAQEVITDPKTMQKYAQYMTEAFLTLLGIAGGKEMIKFVSDNNTPVDLIAENARLKLEIEELRQMSGISSMDETKEEEKDDTVALQEKPSDNHPVQSTEDENPPKPSIHRSKHVIFPKKPGKLSNGQRQLKSIAEKLRLSKDDCAKLTAICAKSLEKGVYIIDNKKTDNSKLAMMLADELKQNKKEPEAVIAKYYKLFGLDTENSVQTVETPNVATEEEQNGNLPATSESEAAVPETKTQEEPSEQTTEATNEKSNPEISEQEDSANQNTPSDPQSPSNVAPRIDACHINVATYDIDPTELHTKGQNVVLIDAKSDLYSYYDTSTFEHDIYTIFQNMQRKFESAVYKNKRDRQRVNWIATSGTAYRVTDNAVENGIKSLLGESACEHLTTDDTTEVAYAINADRRFGEYFRLHGAIRLIDRFANFDDPDTPLEEQCHEMLDCFENIVKRAFHNRINIKLYVDENGDFGERIAISPSSYYEEDKKYFKDKPLILGLGKIYTPSKIDRPPIIITIFNDNNQ